MACLLAWLCIATSTPVRAAEEYQVKAAFLLNFTKFVRWPETAFGDPHAPLAICILGEDPFGNSLNEIVKGETVDGHELEIHRIRRAGESKGCQVLFVSKSEREAARILAEAGPGVLTVGEGDTFLRDGGIIAFVIEDRRVRFDIDQRAAAKAMLAISSRLMMVARSVQQ
jgi:YfiR/HmsC-like